MDGEIFAIVSSIETEDLKETIVQQLADGWQVCEQNYVGENLWELVLVR